MNKKKAFTLIELVVTMSLMGILFVISAPSFSDFQSASRLNSAAQILETTFGEAFSSARSRPECFIVESKESDLNKFSLESFGSNCSGSAKISRDFKFGSGVKFREGFKIKFKPPFGDIESKDSGIIEISNSNEDSVSFEVNKKSGLVTRIANQDS